MNSKVVKLSGFKKQPIGDRVCRSVYQSDTDWSEVQAMALQKGILDPDKLWLNDIARFNEMGSGFPGTVKEFLRLLQQGRSIPSYK
jgi:hypothetical protein